MDEQPKDPHGDCRIVAFARWPRVALEHERNHISKAMAERGAFMKDEEREGLMHDLADLDWVLSWHPERVKV